MSGSPNKKIALSLFLFLACFSACSINFVPQTTTKEQATRETESNVQKYDFLKRLDDVCRTIPAFSDFVLESKGSGLRTRFVSYFFASPTHPKADFGKLQDFYTKYFEEQTGWQMVDEHDFGSRWVTFEKNNVDVQVETAPDAGMEWGRIYALTCKERP